jgi:hypothetical protein
VEKVRLLQISASLQCASSDGCQTKLSMGVSFLNEDFGSLHFKAIAEFSKVFIKHINSPLVYPFSSLQKYHPICPLPPAAPTVAHANRCPWSALSLFSLSPIVPVLGLLFTFVSWGLGLAQTAWFQRWNWFVGILVLSPIAGIFYGIFGKTRRPYSSEISLLVRIYSDKQNKFRDYLKFALIAALIISALGNGIYTSSEINNAIYNDTAPGMESAYATLTHDNPTQYYSLINHDGTNK